MSSDLPDPGRQRLRGGARAEAHRRSQPTATERMETRDERRAERRLGPPTSELVWARPEPGARRARLSREQIAETALEVADAEGLEAVSMRRVAGELGAGTMTLYYYVRSKEELLDLMHDALIGEILLTDDELPRDWRESLTQIAYRNRSMLLRHPWAISAPPTTAGPNGLRHLEQSLTATAALDVDFPTRFAIICAVDDYVSGYLQREISQSLHATGPNSDEAYVQARTDYFHAQLATGTLPRLTELLGDRHPRELIDQMTALAGDPARFDLGLDWVLAGIERSLTTT